MKKKNGGQILVAILVFIPVLFLIMGLVVRSGTTALTHDRVENHCDKRILDALAIQGRGLEALGKINPLARFAINGRRAVDALLSGSAFYFWAIPSLLQQRRFFQGLQNFVDRTQRIIKGTTIAGSAIELQRKTPEQFRGKIHESYKPILPKLHINEDVGYEGEVGAPLEPDKEFDDKQTAQGLIKIFTEKFLWRWPTFNFRGTLNSPNMFLNCKAKIEMTRLEEKWKVQLVKPMDKR